VIFDPAPRLPSPVRTAADAATLGDPSGHSALSTAPEVIRRFVAARPEVPILGFAGAPFTLLCYLVEGKGSKDWVETKKLLYREPALAGALLDRLADAVGDHLQAQVDAGAAAVQMFDTWAGALSVHDYRKWALPAARRALARVRGAPTLYFTKDSAPFLPMLPETGADAIGLDWRVDLAAARKILGSIPVQGNLDPTVLYAPPDEIRAQVRRVLREGGGRGHVFNLGHGILPDAPVSGVEVMVETVKAWAG
nr:uroporphyrinogen decarboxylase [Deltaproteobacteria bacterium]